MLEIEVEVETEFTDDEKDLIQFTTERKKGRILHRVYLKPSKEKVRDELTSFAVCGDFACWRAQTA